MCVYESNLKCTDLVYATGAPGSGVACVRSPPPTVRRPVLLDCSVDRPDTNLGEPKTRQGILEMEPHGSPLSNAVKIVQKCEDGDER